MPSGKLYRGEFARHNEELTVEAAGPLTLDHLGLMTEAAGGRPCPRSAICRLARLVALVEYVTPQSPS